MIAQSRMFPARVVRVHTVTRIEVDIDLGFGVHVNRQFTLDRFVARDVPRSEGRNAVHALVLLIGGKRVFVCPDSTKSDAKTAIVYLREGIRGSPVGYIADAPGTGGPILDVAMFMNWLAEQNFNVELVRSVVHGATKEVPDGSSS